jgi:AraC family transcriptional regulator, regulatory protein of adaptative response / methylated-DNA-[protein]-cysteine methyltransferase
MRGFGSPSYGPRGRGAAISYTIVDSPYGRALVAGTARGICAVSLGRPDRVLIAELRKDYNRAAIARDDAAMRPRAARVLDCMAGRVDASALPLDISATPFQAAVWRELIAIPCGATRSYGEIARRIGRPAAARAVGHAVGSNPLSVVIPCHRAVGSDGSLTGFRWGLDLKRALLNEEASRTRAHDKRAR